MRIGVSVRNIEASDIFSVVIVLLQCRLSLNQRNPNNADFIPLQSFITSRKWSVGVNFAKLGYWLLYVLWLLYNPAV